MADHEPTTSEQLGLGAADDPRSVPDRVDAVLQRLDTLRDRPGPIIALLAAVAVALVVGPRLLGTSDGPAPDDPIPMVTLTPTSAVAATDTGEIVVHISGAVRRPGVYTLPATARGVDAVEVAGGVTSTADVHLINLAALLSDGQQLRIPEVGEVLPPSPAADEAGPIDLNRADVVALQELPGVGPATAAAIVAHRDEHGPFLSVDDLLDVPGIGPAKLDAIRDAAVVR